jgi:hypothetical protein
MRSEPWHWPYLRRMVGCRLIGLVWLLLVAGPLGFSPLGVVPLWALPDAYWVGLDFIDTPTSSPPSFFYDFEPFPITAADNYFVTQGGLASWTENQARRAVALAVEDAFHALEVGDPNRTIGLATYLGSVPESLGGQHLNLMMGRPVGSLTALGETPQLGFYNDPLANDTVVAATYLNNIDGLGATYVTYDTAQAAINAIAGTTAHEIGHVFALEHFAPGTFQGDPPDPWPIMAIEADLMPTEARLTERRFSLDQPVEMPNSELLIENIGTVLRGDFNLDGYVNGSDAGQLISNWGQADRLFWEGDANGDHLIDNSDAGLLIANWSGSQLALANSTMEIQALLAAEVESPGTVNTLELIEIPEPNGLLLACLVGTFLLFHKHNQTNSWSIEKSPQGT